MLQQLVGHLAGEVAAVNHSAPLATAAVPKRARGEHQQGVEAGGTVKRLRTDQQGGTNQPFGAGRYSQDS